MNNFSPNMLKTFDECQQKFFFRYIQKLNVPQRSKIFEKGKKIHALANYYLNGENIEKMEKTLTPDEKITWETLKNNDYFKLKVVNTEYNLSCKVDKYWIGGRLDAFMQSNPSTLKAQGDDLSSFVILDYKTGNIPQNAQWDFQTIVYLLCADKFLNRNNSSQKSAYNSLKFVYLGLKKDIEKEILLTEDLKKQYEDKIVSTCKNLDFAVNTNIFLKNTDCCKNCEYCKICTGGNI